jgi:hypothetical protein
MPQNVSGSGKIPLKPGARETIAALADQFDGWLEWETFELTDTHLTYAYDDIVAIGTAGDLYDFLELIGEQHASTAWAHFGDEDVTYYGPNEQVRVEAEIAQLEIQVKVAQDSLELAKLKLDAIS